MDSILHDLEVFWRGEVMDTPPDDLLRPRRPQKARSRHVAEHIDSVPANQNTLGGKFDQAAIPRLGFPVTALQFGDTGAHGIQFRYQLVPVLSLIACHAFPPFPPQIP